MGRLKIGRLKIINRSLPGWGFAYEPADGAARGAVLLLHGSEGSWAGHSAITAAILAAHGFRAFPFGYGRGGNVWNAGDIRDVPLDRTVAALAALRALDPACPVALYGVSRGAEHALLVAALMAREKLDGQPDALAAHAPPDVVCGAFVGANWRDQGDPGWRAWDPGLRAWTWRGTSDGLLPTTPIEIERYEGPIYISHGERDELWSPDMTHRLEARLRGHGRRPEVHYLPDRGHALFGADEDAHHARLLDFFDRTLGAKG